MNIFTVNNSIMNSVSYIIYSSDVDYCVIIDCGEYETINSYLQRINKTVKMVLLTHGHSDHTYGLTKLIAEHADVPICTNMYGHEEIKDSRKNLSLYHGYPFTLDGYKQMILKDGQILHFNGLADIEVIETPGHTQSCITYRIDNHLFTGDAYIPGIKVFTSFPGANKQLAIKSFHLLAEMEAQGRIIHSGHHSYKAQS